MEAASGSKAMMSCSEFSGEARPAWKTEAEAGWDAGSLGGTAPGCPRLGRSSPGKGHSRSTGLRDSLHRPLQSLELAVMGAGP